MSPKVSSSGLNIFIKAKGSSQGSDNGAKDSRSKNTNKRKTLGIDFGLGINNKISSAPQIGQDGDRIEDNLRRPVYNVRGRLKDDHVQIPIPSKKISDYQRMSKKAIPRIKNCQRISSFSSQDFTHSPSINHQNSNDYLEVGTPRVEDESYSSENLHEDLFNKMACNSHKIRKYIRRKS